MKGEEQKKGKYSHWGWGEVTISESMEALYASVQSGGMKEVDDITLQYCKVFYEHREPVNPTSSSANFLAFLLEVASLLN